jgi:hypothetical protein
MKQIFTIVFSLIFYCASSQNCDILNIYHNSSVLENVEFLSYGRTKYVSNEFPNDSIGFTSIEVRYNECVLYIPIFKDLLNVKLFEGERYTFLLEEIVSNTGCSIIVISKFESSLSNAEKI